MVLSVMIWAQAVFNMLRRIRFQLQQAGVNESLRVTGGNMEIK
jgi:hypothetical protein